MITTSNNPKSNAVGTYTVTIDGKGNYSGSKKLTYTIAPATVTSAVLTKVSSAYSGKTQIPALKDVKAGTVKMKSSDYTVSYLNASKKTISASNIKNAGTYYVKIMGKGNFKGSKILAYKIKQASNKATPAKLTVSQTIATKALNKNAVTITLPKVATKFGKAAWVVTMKDTKNVLSFKSGKVVVKKGSKKGTYTIKLKASVVATKNYKAASTNVVTVKVKVI